MSKIPNPEIWKPIQELESLYLISNSGKIRSLHRKKDKLISLVLDKNGYVVCTLNNKRKINVKIHRLVAIHFIPNPLNLPEVNHLDGDKTNNNDWNLEWSTSSNNLFHAYKIGLKVPKTGIEHQNSKKVYQFDKNTRELIDSHISGTEAMNKTGVNRTDISYCCKGKLKSAGGFIWSFNDKL